MTQDEYIEILANDIGYSRTARNKHISLLIGRDVKWIDELDKKEKSMIIDDFKRIKEDQFKDVR